VGCVPGGGIVASGWHDGGYNGSHQEILNNRVEDIGVGLRDGTCSLTHGIYSAVPFVRIANNVVARALGVGVHLWHAAAYNDIVNNTIVDSGGSGVTIGNGDRGASVAQGDYVANNIITGSTEAAIVECCDVTLFGSNAYVNNLGWRNGSGQELRTGGAWRATGWVEADPLFMSSTDYRLRHGSPAIDSGTATRAPANDYIGAPRPRAAGVDRGALERQPEAATVLSLRAPRRARRGAAVTVGVRVRSHAGQPRGTCVIDGRRAAVGRGRCLQRLRLPTRGRRHVVRVRFLPSSGWRASTASKTIRLISR
jgi:hypothetical protein